MSDERVNLKNYSYFQLQQNTPNLWFTGLCSTLIQEGKYTTL